LVFQHRQPGRQTPGAPIIAGRQAEPDQAGQSWRRGRFHLGHEARHHLRFGHRSRPQATGQERTFAFHCGDTALGIQLTREP
jgi:hypothetical protein